MSVNELLEAHRNEHDDIDEKWNVMKSALCKAAETELGLSSSRQPDWFRDSSTEIRSLEIRYQLWSLK